MQGGRGKGGKIPWHGARTGFYCSTISSTISSHRKTDDLTAWKKVSPSRTLANIISGVEDSTV